jgi:hypothetical protein
MRQPKGAALIASQRPSTVLTRLRVTDRLRRSLAGARIPGRRRGAAAQGVPARGGHPQGRLLARRPDTPQPQLCRGQALAEGLLIRRRDSEGHAGTIMTRMPLSRCLPFQPGHFRLQTSL